MLEAFIAATVEAVGCEPANVAQFVARLDPPADPMLAEKAEQIQAGHIFGKLHEFGDRHRTNRMRRFCQAPPLSELIDLKEPLDGDLGVTDGVRR